ncbi:MAG: GNAT family N-acetyltransferase [Rikenellaceae bacterium]
MASVIFPHTYSPILSVQQVEYMFNMMYAPHNIEHQMEMGHQYFIAQVDSKAVGYLSFREIEPGAYYIEKIYTLPETHGMGVGKRLFEFATELSLHLCSNNSCTLELNVNRFNKRAIGFYSKMGMRAIRQTDECVGKGYYANDYVMRLELTKIV